MASVRPFSSTAEARCQPSPRVPVQPTESGREYSTPPCLDYRSGGKEKREREKREKRKESEFFCFALSRKRGKKQKKTGKYSRLTCEPRDDDRRLRVRGVGCRDRRRGARRGARVLPRGVQRPGVAVRREVGARGRRGKVVASVSAAAVSAAPAPAKVLLLLERRRPVDRRPARPRVLQAAHPARAEGIPQDPGIGVVDAEQLVDLPDLERGGELLA